MIEIEKLELEKERLGKTFQIQKEELSIRRDELELKKKGLEKSKRNILVAVLVAVLTLIGTAYQVYNAGRTSLELEEKKLESSLILKAIETGNRENSRNNLWERGSG